MEETMIPHYASKPVGYIGLHLVYAIYDMNLGENNNGLRISPYLYSHEETENWLRQNTPNIYLEKIELLNSEEINFIAKGEC